MVQAPPSSRALASGWVFRKSPVSQIPDGTSLEHTNSASENSTFVSPVSHSSRARSFDFFSGDGSGVEDGIPCADHGGAGDEAMVEGVGGLGNDPYLKFEI